MAQDDERPSDLDVHGEDFQFAIRSLLGAFEEILKEDLHRAQSIDDLEKEEKQKPANCEDEIALGTRIFEKFFTEEVALRLLPAQARELLGPIERWRWCLLHIRCCMLFGFLVCRGPRTFRAFAYYLYRYWLCVRRAVGSPVGAQLTAEERQDFQVLVQALAGAYKPYLTNQLASVEFPLGIPDEVIASKIDCLEGQDDTAAVFERLLNVQTAPALLGRKAFEAHSREPFFWFCRCWCLCAIRFGCCLARARNLLDVYRCLVFFIRCLLDCFRPLECQITDPHDCVEEAEINTPLFTIFRGVEIRGTAGGAFCSHYTLEWRESGTVAWQNGGIRYAGNPEPAQGLCGVFGGTLGYLQTFPLVPAGPVEIRLCVFSTQGGAPSCCTIEFQLQRNLVWIRGVEGVEADPVLGIFDPNADLITTQMVGPMAVNVVRSFGNVVRVFGSATVGGCEGREIKRYTLSYHPGFVVDPTLPGFIQFWQVDYITPLQKDAGLNTVVEDELTRLWREFKFCFPGPCPPYTATWNSLQGTHWSTKNPQTYPVIPSEPLNPPPVFLWNSTPLPLSNCQSGRYTIRLSVEDVGAAITHDLQRVWFDNKVDGIAKSKISQIAGIPPCSTVSLSQFAVGGGDCSVPWPATLLGIAYDEFIEEGNPAIPSDNFAMVGGVVQGGYALWIKKDGSPDPGVSLQIPGPGTPPWLAGPFQGTSRVGEPGVRCPTAVPPAGVIPAEAPGVLATIDLRRLDAVCNPFEPGLTLARRSGNTPGECCGFILKLLVWDNSICPGLSGGRHQIEHNFPICICNDLPPQ